MNRGPSGELESLMMLLLTIFSVESRNGNSSSLEKCRRFIFDEQSIDRCSVFEQDSAGVDEGVVELGDADRENRRHAIRDVNGELEGVEDDVPRHAPRERGIDVERDLRAALFEVDGLPHHGERILHFDERVHPESVASVEAATTAALQEGESGAGRVDAAAGEELAFEVGRLRSVDGVVSDEGKQRRRFFFGDFGVVVGEMNRSTWKLHMLFRERRASMLVVVCVFMLSHIGDEERIIIDRAIRRERADEDFFAIDVEDGVACAATLRVAQVLDVDDARREFLENILFVGAERCSSGEIDFEELIQTRRRLRMGVDGGSLTLNLELFVDVALDSRCDCCSLASDGDEEEGFTITTGVVIVIFMIFSERTIFPSILRDDVTDDA